MIILSAPTASAHVTLSPSAVRTKAIFKIYTVDSYMEEGLKVHSAADMVEADGLKELHLVMLRGVWHVPGAARTASPSAQTGRSPRTVTRPHED